jgi:membrane-bound serine protease (ClpP class)
MKKVANPLHMLICFWGLMFGFLSTQVLAQNRAFVIELKDEVHAASARHVRQGFEAAQQANADLVIIHLDTYGGRVDFADSIRAQILNSKIPTAVFIDRNAGSAGALISIACDSIYMAPGASIGAATVVDGQTREAAPDKYQSYWRAVMRSTAEIKGRNPQIAEKMVDEELDLPGICPVGKVITFSTQEAIQYGYCDGSANSLQEVAVAMGLESPVVEVFQPSSVDLAINFLLRPAVSSILLLLIFGGIFLEIKTPGFGVGGITAILGLALFFAPHYVEGLAEFWEIGLFGLGLLLLGLEIFVIPGFGVAGILGIALAVLGLGAAMLANRGISFEYVTLGELLSTISTILVMKVAAILVVVVVAKYLVASKAAYPYVDQSTQAKSDGYVALDQRLQAFVGKTGVAATDMRPSGFILVDGEQVDAEAEEGYILKGEAVHVAKIRSTNLIVRKA